MNEILKDYGNYLNTLNYSQETIKKYEANLKILFRILRINNISQLNEQNLNDKWFKYFWENIQKGKIYSDSTKISYLSALKSFVKFLADNNYIEYDFSNKIKIPKKRMLYLQGLSKNQQKILRQYLLKHLKTEAQLRDAALIMFLWGTGCRISEALSLDCHPDSYIYFDKEGIKSGDFEVDQGKVYVHIKGKGKRDRVIIVPSESLMYLNLYLYERKHKNRILFQNVRNNYNSEKRLTRMGAIKRIRYVLNKAGITTDPGLASHILRHTAINNWIERGISAEKIIAQTGHSTTAGLDPYFKRNKHLTDIFANEGLAIINLENRKIKKIENLIKMRHAQRKES